jgi:hypothetical protein
LSGEWGKIRIFELETLKVLKREGVGKGTKYYVVSIPENVDF